MGGTNTAAVAIEAHPCATHDGPITISDVVINDARPGSHVSGVRILGPLGIPFVDCSGYPGGSGGSSTTTPVHVVDRLAVADMTATGIVLGNGARAEITDTRVERSGLNGMLVSTWSDVRVHRSVSGAVNPTFTQSGSHGISIGGSADLTFGRLESYVINNGQLPYDPGYVSATGSTGDGVRAAYGASVQAGYSGDGYSGTGLNSRNRFFGNGPNDASATDSGTSLYARCNWWNDTTPPFETSVTSGAVLYDDLWLTADPYVTPDPPCTAGTGGFGSARTVSGGEPSPADLLIAGAEAPDAGRAVTLLDRVLRAAPASPEAAAAVARLGRIARVAHDRDAANRARALLVREQAGARPAARREAAHALARVYMEAGDATRALTVLDRASALAQGDARATHRVEVERSLALASLGRSADARAALDAADAARPGEAAVALGRRALGRGPRSSQVSLATASSTPVETRVTPSSPPGEDVARLHAPWPNPATGVVTLRLSLADPSPVRVAVYDMLGREVVAVHDGPLGAGPREWTADLGGLGAGVYLVRAEVGGRALTARFSVVR